MFLPSVVNKDEYNTANDYKTRHDLDLFGVT